MIDSRNMRLSALLIIFTKHRSFDSRIRLFAVRIVFSSEKYQTFGLDRAETLVSSSQTDDDDNDDDDNDTLMI